MIQNKKLNLLAFVFISFLVAPIILPSAVKAFDTPAITVTPGVINVDLNEPDQTVESEIEISSNYSEPTTLNSSLSGVDDSSGILVASGPLDDSLSRSLSLSASQATVPANGKATISLKVTNSDLLSPGGHYAAITLSQVSNGTAQINLQSTISISVFIVKRGGEKVAVSISEQIMKLSLFRLPAIATLKYMNSGNIMITPRASITIRSIDGSKVYAKGVSNEGSLSILPSRTLDNTFSITKIRNLPIIPTKLKYITEYRADGVANSQYTEIQSWYIPPVFVLIVLVFVPLSVFLIVKLFKKRQQETRKSKSKSAQKFIGGLISDITPAPKHKKPGQR